MFIGKCSNAGERRQRVIAIRMKKYLATAHNGVQRLVAEKRSKIFAHIFVAWEFALRSLYLSFGFYIKCSGSFRC